MIEIVASIRMHTHTHNQPPHEDTHALVLVNQPTPMSSTFSHLLEVYISLLYDTMLVSAVDAVTAVAKIYIQNQTFSHHEIL